MHAAASGCLATAERQPHSTAWLRQDDDLSYHSQVIMQHAFVLVNAGGGEGDAETRRGPVQRHLGQTDTILGKLRNESGMHIVGRRTDEGMTGAIRIGGDIGRGWSLERRRR